MPGSPFARGDMKAMTIRAEIDLDGTLRLEIPCDLPPGPAEVVVVVHPCPTDPGAVPSAPGPPRARSGLFLDRARSEDDVDAALEKVG